MSTAQQIADLSLCPAVKTLTSLCFDHRSALCIQHPVDERNRTCKEEVVDVSDFVTTIALSGSGIERVVEVNIPEHIRALDLSKNNIQLYQNVTLPKSISSINLDQNNLQLLVLTSSQYYHLQLLQPNVTLDTSSFSEAKCPEDTLPFPLFRDGSACLYSNLLVPSRRLKFAAHQTSIVHSQSVFLINVILFSSIFSIGIVFGIFSKIKKSIHKSKKPSSGEHSNQSSHETSSYYTDSEYDLTNQSSQSNDDSSNQPSLMHYSRTKSNQPNPSSSSTSIPAAAPITSSRPVGINVQKSGSNNNSSKVENSSESKPKVPPGFEDFVPFFIEYKEVNCIRQIGKGGYGTVHLGGFRGRRIAIKALLPDKRHDEKSINGLIREIRLNSMIRHPKIVEFIGVTWDDELNVSVLSEFMVNGDLNKILAKESSKPLMARTLIWKNPTIKPSKTSIAIDVAEAIVYLHSLADQIVHRDLKASNILLTRSFVGKLTDFGISRTFKAGEKMTAGMGTTAWTAPEVIRGEKYSEKADVYSFGVLLSMLDTCNPPYSQANSKDLSQPKIVLMVSLGKLQPQFGPTCPKSILNIAQKCISFHSEDRYNTAELLQALQSIQIEG